MSYTIIDDANGDPVNVATTDITRDGVNEKMELVLVSDPISGNSVSVGAPGAAAANGMFIQFLPGSAPFTVVSSVVGSSNPAVSQVTVGTSSVTLLNANVNRLGFILYNSGNSVAFITYGTVADSSVNYSFTLAPGQSQYVDTLPYRGALAAIVQAGNATIQVTELS